MKKTFNILLIYFLCLVSFVANIKNVSATNISSINVGDLVRSLDSSAVYLIQNGERKVFPHSSVYLSWGYPADFSTVKTITKDELLSYPFGGAIIYRDGFVFRFKGASMPGGFDPSAVFFVSDGKVRPIDSASTYMKLFNEGKNDSSAWDKIYWIPKDLLEEFTYPKGENITSSQVDNGQLPNGLVVKTRDNKIAVVKDGKLSEITDEALSQNRYTTNNKIFENNLVSNVDENIISKVKKGPTISSKDNSLLAVKSIDLTMLPIEEDTSSNTGSTGSTGTNTGTGTTTDTSSVINTTPLTPTTVIPVSKVSEDPFTLTSVLMASDSDKVINIVFNKNVQNTSARNRANYTFKKLDGTVLNSTTGGSRIDSFGHPLVTPVRDSSDNKLVTITLGTSTQDQYAIPAGTYQLCISNMKTATGNETMTTTCKQFNVMSSIRPTLYDNSSSLKYDVNYLASSKKILIKYSEEMGNSATIAANYKMRNMVDSNNYGYGITTWVSLSSIRGTTLKFVNGYGNILITLPSNISMSGNTADFMIGDDLTPSTYAPRDKNGNAFKETTNNGMFLVGYGITTDGQGMFLNGDIENIEIIDETHFSVDFKRYIGNIGYSEFKIKNRGNASGFIPTSASIDTQDNSKVVFTVSSENAFSADDTASDFGISLANSATSTTNTKDIIGLPINTTADEYVYGNNENVVFSSDIGTRIESFVLVDPNNIYLKFNGDLYSSSNNIVQNTDLADNIIIQQDDIFISGSARPMSLNYYISPYQFKDGFLDILNVPNNGYGLDFERSFDRSRNIVRLIFSPELDMSKDVTIKTKNKDEITTLGKNGSFISENSYGLKNELFAAYQVNAGFNIGYGYGYGYGYVVGDNNISYGYGNVYTIKPNVNDFLSIQFNKNLNLNSLSSYGYDWSTEDGISYGLSVLKSLIINTEDNSISFNGLDRLGMFKITGGINNINHDDNLVLDADYSYNAETNILSISINNTNDNQTECLKLTQIYSNIYPESRIIFIPNSNIKDIYGSNISIKFTPTLYLTSRYN